MSQAKCQALIQSKCAPGERGFVTVYDDSLKGEDGRVRFVDDEGIAMRVAEAFTSRNHSPNAPVEQRNNRAIVRVPYRPGTTSTRPDGDVRASEALATEAAFGQLLELLSKPPAHPAEAQLEAARAEIARLHEQLAAHPAAAIAELDEALADSQSKHAAKDEELAALRARVAELEAMLVEGKSESKGEGAES